MSTSKENYDHLVYLDGNYGIDISKGIWPGSGQQPGIKGDKGDDGYGEKGAKGQKGQPGTNGSDGNTGGTGQKGAPGPQGVKGGKGQKGQQGVIGDKGIKGSKGIGEKGEKGETAATPVFEFKGSVATVADLPPTGNSIGDVYQVNENDFLYAWDGTQWVTIAEAIGVVKGQKGEQGQKGVDGALGQKGATADKGQKGATGGQGFKGQKGAEAAKGNKGQKGGKGEPGVAGTDGTNGGKGQKGQKGLDPSALNSYYTKTQTDFLIEDFKAPQYAFDVASYPSGSTNVISSGAVDFNSVNQNDPVYNSGIVTIGSAVTVSNSPIAASELMVINYVAVNAGDLRGTDYALLQYAFNAAIPDIAASGYWRFVKPAIGQFGAWNLGQFPIDNYYTKAQVDNLHYVYNIEAGGSGSDTTSELKLTDNRGTTDTVNIIVSGGLTTSADANSITIDASAISGNVTFEGGIAAADPGATPPIVAQDPATLDPTPNGGDYFIFTNAGTAWNGDTVTEGDWAIYRAADTTWVTLDYQTSTIGVASVAVAGGLLTKTGPATDPVIGLTAATIETDVLGPYAKTVDVNASIAAITLNDLANVEAASPASNAVIRYNTTSSKWELSTSYNTTQSDQRYVRTDADSTISGTGVTTTIARNNSGSSAFHNSFVINGRITTNGTTTAQMLKTVIQGSGSTLPDYIEYYGDTGYSKALQTQSSVNTLLGSYLPLSAGTSKKLSGDLYLANKTVQVQDSTSLTNVKLSTNGNVQMGQVLSMYRSTTQSYIANVGILDSSTKRSNSYLDIRTTDNSGNYGAYGTIRIGQTNSTSTYFIQCFSPGTSTPTMRVKRTSGIIQCPESTGTFASLTNQELPTKAQVSAEIQANTTAGIPTGSIMAWPAGGQPQGWLKMNGQSYNPSDYPVLDSVLAQMAGYIQGTIPDWKGLHLVAYGGSFAESLGTVIGSRTAMPNLPFGTATDGDHFHGYGSNDRYGGGTTKSAYDATPRLNSFNTTTAGAHVHTIVGGDPVTNPPCAVIQWIIKTDG